MEVVLMLVFLATAVLRSALSKQDLVDAQLLSPESLTVEEKRMPKATACPRPVTCARFCCGAKAYGLSRVPAIIAARPCV